MILDEGECWARLSGADHGVLGTVHPGRGVDAVPVVFAVVAPAGAGGPAGAGIPGGIVIPVDAVKAKRSVRLQRLKNLDRDPRCVLLVDHYDDDWSRLWWVRIHARGRWSEPTEAARARLGERFPPYREPGAIVGVVTLEPTEVSGWRA